MSVPTTSPATSPTSVACPINSWMISVGIDTTRLATTSSQNVMRERCTASRIVTGRPANAPPSSAIATAVLSTDATTTPARSSRHQERQPARGRIACSRAEAGERVAGQEAAPQPEREGSGRAEHDQADVERCSPHLVAGAEQQVEAGADQLARADDRRRFGGQSRTAGCASGDVSACSIPVTRVRPAASRPPRPARRSGQPRRSRPTARPQPVRRRRSGSAPQGPRPARRPRPARAPA